MPSIGEALRDAMSKAETGDLDASNIDAATLDTSAPDTPEPQTAIEQDDRPGRTAGRARAPDGKLLPGKAVRPDAQVSNVAATLDKPAPSSPALAAAAAPQAPAPTRPAKPSTWKKELDPHWDTLPAEVQSEILRREGDYAKGVSTYKAEFDRLKGWDEAVQPYLPTLQQYGLDPVKHTAELMRAHNTLALGAPEQKLAMFAQLAQQYQVPLQNMFVRGQDGQVYLNQQLLNQQAAPQPARPQPQQDPRQIVRDMLVEERAQTELQRFEQDTKQYPHYQQVKASMGRLLELGEANDLPSAYEAALALPKYASLREADQQQARAQEAERVAREKQELASRARANALSPRSSTPTSAAGAAPAKGLRGAIEEAFDAHSGRV